LSLANHTPGKESSFYQHILEHRAQLNLRSVDSIPNMLASFEQAIALSHPLNAQSAVMARAWGWSDIWNGVKKAAGWVGDQALKVAQPLVQELPKMLLSSLAATRSSQHRSASGRAASGRAASGRAASTPQTTTVYKGTRNAPKALSAVRYSNTATTPLRQKGLEQLRQQLDKDLAQRKEMDQAKRKRRRGPRQPQSGTR
jgi:hypothetical protein